MRRVSKSFSRGVWFLLVTWRWCRRVQVACRLGASPVLLDRLSSEVACLSSGRCRGRPLRGASVRERVLFCFLGSSGEGGGANRRASTSRALERRRAALTTMFWSPFEICCRSVETRVLLSFLLLLKEVSGGHCCACRRTRLTRPRQQDVGSRLAALW